MAAVGVEQAVTEMRRLTVSPRRQQHADRTLERRQRGVRERVVERRVATEAWIPPQQGHFVFSLLRLNRYGLRREGPSRYHVSAE